MVLRLAAYVLALALGAACIILMPDGKIPLISKMGSRSLDVFFWHRPLYLIINCMLPFSLLVDQGLWGKIAYLGLALAVTCLLSLGGPISYPLGKVKSWCFTKRNKKVTD